MGKTSSRHMRRHVILTDEERFAALRERFPELRPLSDDVLREGVTQAIRTFLADLDAACGIDRSQDLDLGELMRRDGTGDPNEDHQPSA